jgi:uncharacterized membrane protein YgdD (TMEM256/DUF423 family)
MRLWILIGSISGGLSVITGAFGAHGLRDQFTPRQMEIYQTACHYQLIHALALIALGIFAGSLAKDGLTPTSLSVAGWAFTVGTIIFSGSLYALAITDIKILGAITPIGGLAFIVGWFSLAYTAFKMSNA